MQYFISHESKGIKKAIRLKELLEGITKEHKIFLTSDWDSIGSGDVWMSDIFNMLQNCDQIIVLITSENAFKNLWINFEVGACIGRGLKPKIFVWGNIDLKHMEFPIKGIHCIGCWDTNRWVKEFRSLGYNIQDTKPFSELFYKVESDQLLS